MGKKQKRAKKVKNNPSIARSTIFSEEKFRVESAADTMMRMQEIAADPKLKKKADTELARRAKAISRARKV